MGIKVHCCTSKADPRLCMVPSEVLVNDEIGVISDKVVHL